MKNKTSSALTIFIALLPLVLMYKVPGTEMRLPTLLTAIAMIFCVAPLYKGRMKVSFGFLLPLYLYLVYVMMRSTVQLALINVAVIIILSTICTGIINVNLLRGTIEKVAVIASICVLFQQIVHVVTGSHIPMYVYGLLASDILSSYRDVIATGISDNLYRPCAFFIEPAQYAQYCVIGLGSCLFTHHISIKKAVFITVGILACTSGMGFVSALAMWGWWFLNRWGGKPSPRSAKKLHCDKPQSRSPKQKTRLIRNLLIVIPILIVVFFLLDKISFTHSIINRFTTSEEGEYNAITGRLFWWNTYFGDFNFSDFLCGFGLESLPEDIFFTGFMKQLFCYGIVGISLLIFFLVRLDFKSDKLGVACVTLYIGLLFFAELTSYNNLLFFVGTFLALLVAGKSKTPLIHKPGFKEVSNERNKSNKSLGIQ